jgi:hypothetical protein
MNGLTRCFLGEFATARALLEQCHGLGDPAHRGSAGVSEDLSLPRTSSGVA